MDKPNLSEEMNRVNSEAAELQSVIECGLANATILELRAELQRRLDDCDSGLDVMLVSGAADELALHIKNDTASIGTKYEQALLLSEMIIRAL